MNVEKAIAKVGKDNNIDMAEEIDFFKKLEHKAKMDYINLNAKLQEIREKIEGIEIQIKSEADYFNKISEEEISIWAKEVIEKRIGNIYRRFKEILSIFDDANNKQEEL